MALHIASSVGKALLLCSFASTVLSAPVENGPTVTLASGVIIGTTTKPSNQPSLAASANAYLGVPFAKSPPLRFAPPEAALPWSSPLQAQTVKPSCIQQFSGTGGVRDRTIEYFNDPTFPPPEESEDCLYLNVYTPPGVTSSSKKAVMFWLFGVCIYCRFTQTRQYADTCRGTWLSELED